ncbi:MAG: leucyl aminopeptidase [Ferrimicrobium sp.]|uniref:Probable cytosol aminopeptidase n=1 Tax=Ferrimicrobium acidiphilum TaxID=121039 RepID=A0ABV3Y0L3_9ACTN|nr:leucyl aminopeptidase [Ferrimicrobium sp.]
MGLKTSVTITGATGLQTPVVRIQPGEHSTKMRAVLHDGDIAYEFGIAPDPTVEQLRSLGAAIVDELSRARFASAALLLADLGEQQLEELFLGMLLAGYRFDAYRTKEDADSYVCERVQVVGGAAGEAALARASVLAEAVALARDLINEPPSRLTPVDFARIAGKVAEQSGLEIRIWDEQACEREHLGGLLGVARGSAEPPRAIKLTYRPEQTSGRTVGLVGKGITFDSGGLSLKSGEGMMAMKTDMGGAAAVLAAMSTLRALGVTHEVNGYLMMTENMPSGSAQKPGDVLVTRSGRTIEVLNTDAEGRLVLADGLTLALEDGNQEIVDIATLTGACVVALGDEVAGLMGSDEGLIHALHAAGARAAEPNWQLPLPKSYEKLIASEVADMKNIGKRGAGAITAALLLQRFVPDVRWAHLDIAGPSRAEGDRGWVRAGATGFGVLTFVRWLQDLDG